MKKKTGKGIVLTSYFKKQCGKLVKQRRREDEEYEQQGTKNKKLRRSGPLIKCSNRGRQRHNKKSYYRQSKTDTHAGPTAEPSAANSAAKSAKPSIVKSVGPQSVGPTPIAPKPSDGSPPIAVQPPPTAGTAKFTGAQSTGPLTVGPSKTAKASSTKGKGWAKLPIRRSHK